MIIRFAELKDLPRIQVLYNEEEITLPEKFISSFVIEDLTGMIIAAGGITALPELSIAIEKDLPDIRKVKILKMVQSLLDYKAENGPFYVFVNDATWEQHLLDNGFRHAEGKVLIYG